MEVGWKVKYGDRIGRVSLVERTARYGVEVEFSPEDLPPDQRWDEALCKRQLGYFDFQGRPEFKNPEFEGKLELIK